VALNLYLDDCANSDLLAQLLTAAGHMVVRPTEVGTAGEDDEIHFAYAAANGPVLLTKNPPDFQALHEANPAHPGIFAVYQDNDLSRDMTQAEIVAVIAKIEAAVPHGYPIAGEFHSLNAWR
jgi:hypothetical protein